MSRMLREFKEFAMKGNVVDLAVGVIIGVAFGAIVSSMVQDVLMPPLGWITGGLDFKDKVLVLQPKGAKHLISGKVLTSDVVVSYGKFINATIQFLIQAFAIFIMVKLINSAKRQPEAAPSAPPAPTRDQELLVEIRDALRTR